MPEVRDTHVTWTDSGLSEATTESGEAVSVTKGNTVELERWQDAKKPALVYWTWSDEEDKRGKDTKKTDRNTWDNEQVARAARLYTCYRVDAKDVPASTLAKLGVSQVPFVQVVSNDRLAVASTVPGSSNAMEGFLRTNLQRHFAEYWRAVLARAQELAKKLDEAKAAMKKKDFDGAVSACGEIMNDDVRTETLDKARDLLAQARAKAAKEAKK